MQIRTYTVIPDRVELRPYLKRHEVIAHCPQEDGSVAILLHVGAADYRSGDGCFPKAVSRDHNYVVLHIREGLVAVTGIERRTRNDHFVQIDGEGRILLVGARCEFAGESPEPNAALLSPDGETVGELTLGDGIADVHLTGDRIWVSYFDEGTFGVWGGGRPIGACGIRRFDLRGGSDYEYLAPAKLAILDCYAMTAVSDNDAWACYHPDFPVVRIRPGRPVEWWASPVSGASGIAVRPPFVALLGSYDDKYTVSVLKLAGEHMLELVAKVRLAFADEDPIPVDRMRARADRIHVLSDGRVATIRIADLV
ncbi:MAG: hypothetical protein AMXMBFR47_39860 [Planctomycetota bacterium]